MRGAIRRRMARHIAQSNLVVPAADRTAGSGRDQSAGRRAIAAHISDGGLCGPWQPAAGRKAAGLSFDDAKSFPGYDEQYGKPLRMLMAMVGLVLLIALSNVVMLLMARNATRQREFSRASGAGRAARRAVSAVAHRERCCWCARAAHWPGCLPAIATQAAGRLGADRVQPRAGQDRAAVHSGHPGLGGTSVWPGAAACCARRPGRNWR